MMREVVLQWELDSGMIWLLFAKGMHKVLYLENKVPNYSLIIYAQKFENLVKHTNTHHSKQTKESRYTKLITQAIWSLLG